MGVATQLSKPASQYVIPPPNYKAAAEAVAHTGLNSPTTTSTSMSQGFHQGIFSFSDGFVDRSVSQEQQQRHVAQQSRRDKLRVQGFDGVSAQHHPLVPIEEEGGTDAGIYESSAVGEPAGNMLSDMFNFAASGTTATDLLASQISGAGGYRFPLQRPGGMAGFSGDWYGASRQGMVVGGTSNLGSVTSESPTSKHQLDGSQQQHPVTGLNVESAAAMQLFLMNPPPQAEPQPRSPSSAPHSALHPQAFIQSFGEAPFAGGMVEGRGLSLSLSSHLQPFEMEKSQELRVREGVLYFNNQQQEQHPEQQQQPPPSQQQIHMGYGAMGVVNILRNSKYSRAAQELLEEFCSVGRGQIKGSKMAKSSNPNHNTSSGGGAGASTSAAASSSAKDVTPLSPADRFEQQRKKTKLISMLDEVDRRYNHYCDQMQMVVNSFDTVMGFGAATPYTALAQKAMSRHFRCLKDAIVAQLKQTCELLGEKEGASSSGITKGETPRLRLLDQSLRQQRAFHQMGMMEQEAWRPQRGLPERSVNILRAWLFEHFLHPYPSDADKHLLARQTGLSRNQVSNWFINARVRLWKPMVEDMYQQEFKDGEEGEKSEASHQTTSQSPTQQQQQQDQRTRLTNMSSEAEPSPSSSSISRHHHRFAFPSDNSPTLAHQAGGSSDSVFIGVDAMSSHTHINPPAEDIYRYGAAAAAAAAALSPSGRMRFGTAAGDVSLTLGLRHGAGGNAPESSRSSSLRDFGG